MHSKRFLVRGLRSNRNDPQYDEWVDGYLISGDTIMNYVDGGVYFHNMGSGDLECYGAWGVDPDTVEPVAVPVAFDDGDVVCPCCGWALEANIQHEYCYKCGQRCSYESLNPDFLR